MSTLARRVYHMAGKRLSRQQKQTVKTFARRMTSRSFRRRVRSVVHPRSGGGGGAPRGRRSKEERALERQVRSMSEALWMGFTDDAVVELERLRRRDETYRLPTARAAETLARWHATQAQYETALERLIHARALNGDDHTERLRVLEHHLLTQLGLFEEAEALFRAWGSQSSDLEFVQANLRLRQADEGKISQEQAGNERLELIDRAFQRYSLTTISELVDTSAGLQFATLRTVLPDVDASANPTVSVVVPAYNAESTLVTSVNSLRAQSIEDIEILIVDDASTDNTGAVAKALASDDARVKVLQHDNNQGAYAARNTGLANARGEFFTVHDSDDWSHPQQLERQLLALRSNNAAGSFSRLARVDRRLEFQLRVYRPMLEPIHWNYMSLLARTQVIRDFGGWDAVRAHADSELIERMRDYFGKDSLVEGDAGVPLTFCLTSDSNITENKNTSMRSIEFGSRREYMAQSRFWRERTFAAGELPSYRDHERTDTKSPFFAAAPLVSNGDDAAHHYDLIIGSDLALLGGTRRCNLAYIDCARKLGLRVGIVSMPRYRCRGSGQIDSTYRELFQQDDVDLITPEMAVSAETMLVHHPPVLRHAFTRYPKIEATNHYLLVNQLPWHTTDFSGVEYDTSEVHRRYADAFGGDPVWISISPRVRRYLEIDLSPENILDEDWYPIVSWADVSPSPRTVRAGAAPIVGRHSRDHATKWPEDAETLAKCYLADTDFDVRLVGGAEAAERVLGYRPENWTVYPFDSLSISEFVQDIDIFVHFHHSLYIEEFGRNIAEAMAMGVPCVLPPDYAETFGEAAVYAEPDDVATTIRDLWADGDRYEEYSRRGIGFVADYCGSEVGMRRLTSSLK